MKLSMILAAIITLMITVGTYLAVQQSSILPENSQVEDNANNADQETRQNMSDEVEAINQETIDGKVKASLIASSKVSGLAIDVEKKDTGHVILDGYVVKPEEKALAQSIALRINGVEKVTNNLEVDESVGVDDAYQPFPIQTTPTEL